MGMQLYHHPFSANSRRALMTALHLGLAVEVLPLDFTKGEHVQPDYLRLNPNHRVPVLIDGDYVLWESYAIMQYLADREEGRDLYPLEPRARCDINRWLFWCSQHFQPAVSILNVEHAVKPMMGWGPADPAQVALGEKLFAEFAAVLDAHLAGREWICGQALSLADLAIAAALGLAGSACLPLAPYKEIARWLARIEQLDAWRQTVVAA